MGQLVPADILAVGMVTPVGLTAPTSAAAIRAGITRLRESNVRGRRFQRQVMGLVGEEHLPPLSATLAVASEEVSGRHVRMLRLATRALQEVLGDWKHAPPPLMLALPEALPAGGASVGAVFARHLELQTGVKLNPRLGRVFFNGRAGGLLALRHAMELLSTRQVPTVCVGGVDTFLDLRLLADLEEQGRLRSEGVSDAFIPGESAAFLLLGAPGVGKALGRLPLAQVVGAEEGVERGHLYSQAPHLGDGLADAFRALFGSLPAPMPRVACVYAGLNGERCWAKDWGVASLRNIEHFEERLRIEHPVEFIGDIGAALGPLMVGLAAIGLYRGYRQGPILVWCASDLKDRAAALVQTLLTRGG